MITKNILDYVSGTISIVVEGFFIEKYINMCSNRKIKLNNIKKNTSCMFTTSVKIKDYLKLKKVCRITKCKMKILERNGLPFLLHRYRKRKIALIPIIFIVGILIYANSLIWNIKVINNNVNVDEYTSKSVINAIDELGIDKFSFKYFINKEKIKNNLIVKVEELSWVELKIKGVTLIVDIHTRTEKPKIEEKDEISNIVAKKSGIIEKVIVRSGNAIVKKDDIVEKGEILVSYIMPSQHIDERFVYTDAEIYARIWYSKKVDIPLNEKKIMYTGNEEIVYGTNILNKKVFFKKLSTNYKEYDTILNEKKLTLGNYQFPITVYEYIIREKETINTQRNVSEAEKYGSEILEAELISEMLDETVILDRRIIVNKKQESIEIEIIYECLEQIGTKEKND